MGKLADDLEEIENMDLKPMAKSPVQQRVIKLSTLTGIISQEVGYFNGWSVPRDQMMEDCEKAAKRILGHLRRMGVKIETL